MRGIAKTFTVLFFILLIGAAVLSFDKDYGFLKRGNLKEAVAKSLADTKGNYAIVIQNLKTLESYSLNKDKIFQPGSLYKLWIMAVAFEQIKNGDLKEDEVLEAAIEELNEEFEIATEEAELTQGTVSMTVKQALEQMITISHNYAALLLTQRVRNSNVTNFLKRSGFHESSIGEPSKTTASDIASFYEKLYKGEVVDEKYSKRMIGLLSRQKLNDRIPKYLPKDVKVAHKTGEIKFFKHDAGIVFTGKGDYIIVVLSESDFPLSAAERIANLSKNVYEYFER